MRAGNMGVPTMSEWLDDVLTPGSRVGIDPVRPFCDVTCLIAEVCSAEELN